MSLSVEWGSVPRVELSEELRALQARWLESKREDQDRLYAEAFGPRFAPLFAKLPLARAPRSLAAWRPKAVVSVLGLSWQPAALMAAWARPDRMLLVGTAESLSGKVAGEPVLDVIARVSGVPRDRFRTREVGEHGEVEIYRAVRDFCTEHGLDANDVLIDPTGGKKSMSVAAGLAGFLLGARAAYVDYGEYHGRNRIPVAGTEYPRLLGNPLDELGDLEFDRIRRAFDGGGYLEAQRRAEELAHRLYEPRLADLYRELARGYGAWEGCHLKEARAALERAEALVDAHGGRPEWAWTKGLRPFLARHVPLLGRLAAVGPRPDTVEEGLALVWNHLATGIRALGRGQASAATMIFYGAVEQYARLWLEVEHGLYGKRPDLDKAGLDWDRYHALGAAMKGGRYERRRPEGRLLYAQALWALGALRPDLILEEDMGPLDRLGDARNSCELSHGSMGSAVRVRDAHEHLETVKRVLGRAQPGLDLDAVLEDYGFPTLGRM